MVYAITLTNPLASGHDGSWKLDLLMECVVGTLPAYSPPSPPPNDAPLAQAGDDEGDIGGGGGPGNGGGGGGPIDGIGSGGGASAVPRGSPQPPNSFVEEVKDDELVSEDDAVSDDYDDSECSMNEQDNHGEVSRGEVPQGEVPQGEVPQGEVPQPQGDADGGSGGGGGTGEVMEIEDLMDVSEDDEEDGNDESCLDETTQPVAMVVRGRGEEISKDHVDIDAGAVDCNENAAEEKATKEDGGKPESPERIDGGGSDDAADSALEAAPTATEICGRPPDREKQLSPSLLPSKGDSNEEEKITKAIAAPRMQPPVPTTMPLSDLDRALDEEDPPGARSVLALASTPPRSPPTAPARSSIGRLMSDGVGDDSEFSFGSSGEDTWSSSDEESENDDSDDYEPDVLPPACSLLHRDRKTYKMALCEECYEEYTEALRKANLDIADIDPDTGRRKNVTRRRQREERKGDSSGGGMRGVAGKRSRRSRSLSDESNGHSSGKRKKRRRVVEEEEGAVPIPAPTAGRRLVKPHQKKGKKLVTGAGEKNEASMRLLEDTSSSSSDGSDVERSLDEVPGSRGKNKRTAEEVATNKRANGGSPKQKQNSKGGGSGGGADLLGALIEKPSQARKRTNLSTTQSALDPQPNNRPPLVKQRSADTVERRTGGAGTDSDVGSRLQLARALSHDAAVLSLTQYKTRGTQKMDPQTSGGIPISISSKNSVKPSTGSKAAVAPNNILGKKRGKDDSRQRSRAPAHKGISSSSSSSSSNGSISNSSNRGGARESPAPIPVGSRRINTQYDEVDNYIGVRRKKSNGKYFVWVGDQPLDGTEYCSAEECAKAYAQLHQTTSARGSQRGPKPTFSNARAPTHVEIHGLTPLVSDQGSRLAKGGLKSGYSKPPFFAPKERSQPPPRQTTLGAPHGRKPSEAEAARRRPSKAVMPQQQHGAAAALALIGSPNAGPSGRMNYMQPEPLPPVDGFGKPRSKIRWSSPIMSDEDLNGRRKLPPASKLPARSGLQGGRAGRPAPDTRHACAQTGLSGEFLTSREDEEEEGRGDPAGVRGEPAQLSSAEAIAPARGSLLERLPDGVSSHEHGELGDTCSPPQGAVVPGVAASTASISAAPSVPPGSGSFRELGGSPTATMGRLPGDVHPGEPDAGRTSSALCDPLVQHRQENAVTVASQQGSPKSHAVDSVDENRDEEQGRELLMMSMMACGPEEQAETLTRSMVADCAVSEGDDGDFGGEEEQGRELMMRMFSGGDPPSVSPPAFVDEKVPPSPQGARSEDDDSSSSSSSGGENEEDAVMSLADVPPPPRTTVAWRTPKMNDLGGGGGSGTSTSTITPDSDCPTASSTTTYDEPRQTPRRFYRIDNIAAAPSSATTSSSHFSHKLPIDDDSHSQNFVDAHTMRGPPNPPFVFSETRRQVVWRNPRQTAAVPSVTPTSSFDLQQENDEAQQNGKVSPSILQRELPPEVAVLRGADTTNPEMPPTFRRTSGRSDRVMSCAVSHKVQRHEFSRTASTSPHSSSLSCVEASSLDEQDEAADRGTGFLPPFGLCAKPDEQHSSIPPHQLALLARNAARQTTANPAPAMLQRREEEQKSKRRPLINEVRDRRRSIDGERPRSFEEGRSGSLSSGPTTREGSSCSSTKSNNSMQRRPDFIAGEESRSRRDGRGRGDENGWYDRGRRVSSPSSSRGSSVRTVGRMVGYHDDDNSRECRDGFGRDARGVRGRFGGGGGGGHDSHRDTFGRDARNGESRSGARAFSNYRGSKYGGEGGGDHGVRDSVDRRHARDSNRSESRRRREQSRSPHWEMWSTGSD